MPNISSVAYLCKNYRHIQSEGMEGVLTFDGELIAFQSKDGENKTSIHLTDLALADLNNVMAEAQIVLHTNDGQSYVFTFYPPVSVKKRLFMGFYPRAYRTYVIGTALSNDLTESKKWRDALIATLPAAKVKYRKEVRPWFIVLGTLGFFAFLALLFALYIYYIMHK